MNYNIYTDGCLNAIGFGESVVILDEKEQNLIAIHNSYRITPVSDMPSTNNREELKAILNAVNYIKEKSNKEDFYNIFSDSNYAVKSITEWMLKWHENSWINSQKKPVENKDLMLKLYYAIYGDNSKKKNYKINWIKGHNNYIGNELADAIATRNAKKFKKLLIENNINYTKVEIF